MLTLTDLIQRGPVLFDGGLGTMLMARGLPAGQPGELFTVERPDAVAEVHGLYAAAGSRVLTTNTFNGNRIRLRHAHLEEHIETCNRRAVELVRRNADGEYLVAGSIGPTGLLLEPLGELSEAEAEQIYAEQARLLDAAGVDLLLIETMFDLNEALAAVRACRQVSTRPVVATMTFSETPRGFYTMMGQSAAESLPQLVAAGAVAVGANCTLASAGMTRLAGQVRRAVDVPLLIQPNAGQPGSGPDATAGSYSDTPDVFAENAARMVCLGVQMIGGCCGTNPDFIAAAATRLQRSVR